MTMRYLSILACALVSQTLYACNAKSADPGDLAGVPEVAAVEMPLTGDTVSEGMATADDAIDAAALAADELLEADVPDTTNAQELGRLRGAVKDLNDSMRDFLNHVAAIVRDESPTYHVGAVRMWGPETRGATEYRFFLRRGVARHWSWRLDARLANSSALYSRVAAGVITVGAVARRGVGAMGFDLDALSSADPTVAGQGQLLVGFRHGDLGTSIGYAARDFARSPDPNAGVDALLRAIHRKDGRNRVRLAFRGNVEGTATSAAELVLARVRHHRGEGGRSDIVALEGDVPSGEALVISQCWNDRLEDQYRVVRRCPLDGIDGERCTVTETSGDASACSLLLRAAEFPPTQATAEMPDEEDPNADVTAPTEFPEVEGDDASN